MPNKWRHIGITTIHPILGGETDFFFRCCHYRCLSLRRHSGEHSNVSMSGYAGDAKLNTGRSRRRPFRCIAWFRLEMVLLRSCHIACRCYAIPPRRAFWLTVKVLCFGGVFLLYYPPKHPRGVPWKEALRNLDWVGMVLFVVGGTLTLAGLLLTTTIPSSDRRVVAPLTIGLVFVAIFGLWENQAEQRFGVRYPLCPRHVFTRGKGRDMTAPFLVVFVSALDLSRRRS